MDKKSCLAPVCKKWMNAAFEEVVFWSVTLYLTSNWSIHVAFVGKQLRKHQSKHMHSYRVFKQLLTGWNLKNFKNTALTPCIKSWGMKERYNYSGTINTWIPIQHLMTVGFLLHAPWPLIQKRLTSKAFKWHRQICKFYTKIVQFC